jgi:hypothetical protein
MPNKLSKPFLFSLNIRKILSSYTIPLLVLFVIFQLTVYYDCMVYHIIFLYNSKGESYTKLYKNIFCCVSKVYIFIAKPTLSTKILIFSVILSKLDDKILHYVPWKKYFRPIFLQITPKEVLNMNLEFF